MLHRPMIKIQQMVRKEPMLLTISTHILHNRIKVCVCVCVCVCECMVLCDLVMASIFLAKQGLHYLHTSFLLFLHHHPFASISPHLPYPHLPYPHTYLIPTYHIPTPTLSSPTLSSPTLSTPKLSPHLHCSHTCIFASTGSSRHS